jgi:hypothetical protein
MNIQEELKCFKDSKLWTGGYCEGDPLDPNALSSYPAYLNKVDNVSTLHATYLKCIKPYINQNTIALEIGVGRGAWTKCMLDAKEIIALDIYSAEHNKFYEHVGINQKIKYFEVNDFTCSMVPEDYVTYMFSYGCLCHVSFDGCKEYAKNLYSKLKVGAQCFWMVAGYDKYNSTSAHKLPREEDSISPGRWFDNWQKLCEILPNIGYKILETDTKTNIRDPIIHFTK